MKRLTGWVENRLILHLIINGGNTMANFKVVISDPKSKKAYQKEVDQASSGLIGKKVGEKVTGSGLGLDGFELQVTGGSDKEGFPMRPDVEGPGRKKIILTDPPGYHPKHKGKRKRKSVRGNTVSTDISQVNIKVVKSGSKKLEELMGKKKEEKAADKKEEAKPEGKAAEKPAEEKKGEAKEAKPADAKPAEKPTEAKPEQKPAEEKKEEAKDAKPADASKAEAKMGVKKVE
jgi:small subunit ribosomal protein S6e